MTTTTRPSAAELRAAVETVLRAWAPQLLTPPSADEADVQMTELDDWTQGCGCGGGGGDDDDNFEPYCNCGDACGCKGCEHTRHERSRTCGVRECWAPTRYRIASMCLHRNGVQRTPSDGDPAPRTGVGNIVLGDSVQRHPHRFACSTQHARELIDADRAYRAAFEPGSVLHADQTFYEVEGYRYEPDSLDVPGALHPLQGELQAGVWAAGQAIMNTAGVGFGGLDNDVAALHRTVARTVYWLLKYDQEQAEAAQRAAEEEL